MGRDRKSSREELPRLRAIRSPPGPPATLANLQRDPKWVWLHCHACPHHAPAAVAPFVIRWGPEASPDLLRQAARCTACGGKGAMLMRPSWAGNLIGWAPFPIGRLAKMVLAPVQQSRG